MQRLGVIVGQSYVVCTLYYYMLLDFLDSPNVIAIRRRIYSILFLINSMPPFVNRASWMSPGLEIEYFSATSYRMVAGYPGISCIRTRRSRTQ